MKQINLSQIVSLEEMNNNLKELKTSYDADKIITNIHDEAGKALTANYLFNYLKRNLDIMRDSTIYDIRNRLSAIEEKEIEDYVRVYIHISNGTTNTIIKNIPGSNLAEQVPVYTVNNETLYNQNGSQLMFTPSTGTFNGIPSVIDIEGSKTFTDNVYIPVENIQAKIFIKGKWSLKNLPKDALVDNEEMRLITYKNAIDQLTVNLAKNKLLIEEVQKLISLRAMQTALDELSQSIDERFAEKSNELNKKIDKESITSSVHDISDVDINGLPVASKDKPVSELGIAAIVDSLHKSMQDVIDNCPSSYRFDKIELEGTEPITSIKLKYTPIEQDSVYAIVDHKVYCENENFIIDYNNKIVSWLPEKSFELLPENYKYIIFVYKVKEFEGIQAAVRAAEGEKLLQDFTDLKNGLVVVSADIDRLKEQMKYTFKNAGTISADNIPDPNVTTFNNIYSINEEFRTTDDFIEGANKSYAAYTKIVCIKDENEEFKWSIFGGANAKSGNSSFMPDEESNTSINTDVIATIDDPKVVDIAVSDVSKFDKSSLSITKLVDGIDKTLIMSDFNNENAIMYDYDNTNLEMNGLLHFLTEMKIKMSIPQKITNGTDEGYFSVSDEIDTSQYQNIDNIEVY